MDTTTTCLPDSQVKSLLSLALASPAPHVGVLLAEVPRDQREAILAAALDDLNVPLGEIYRGLLGLQRLTGISATELEPLRNRTVLSAIADARIRRTSLNALCEYSDLL